MPICLSGSACPTLAWLCTSLFLELLGFCTRASSSACQGRFMLGSRSSNSLQALANLADFCSQYQQRKKQSRKYQVQNGMHILFSIKILALGASCVP
ncbi:hypothetical protein M758_3G178500 [Ceratodon purpureus]|uniref:Secreted protein n=1 Tax=Ceratodon purpureus TaxID=3225 RepID=A0A8T0IJP3_CERPU|nr:hypothetical protein KC19_3G177900 [Ceratodon purpureus]KAG0623493.1 hypothetical protein M758_3G178500 [Ceratodon purpureus]